MEFRRAIVPQLVGSVLFVAICLVATHYNVLRQIVAIIFFVSICSAFGFGGSAFWQDFKQHQRPLLMTLPVSRSTVWWSILIARALAMLPGVASVVTLALLVKLGPTLALSVALIYVASFAFGVHSGEEMSEEGVTLKDVVNWGAPLAVTFATIAALFILSTFGEIWLLSLLMQTGAEPSAKNFFQRFGGLDPFFAAVGCALWVFLFLWLARRVFMRGEHRLVIVRARNVVTTLIGVLLLSVVLSILATSGVFSAFDKWEPVRVVASADGKYLAIIEWSNPHLRETRLTTLDLATGRVFAQRKAIGLASLMWPEGSGSFVAPSSGYSLRPFVMWRPLARPFDAGYYELHSFSPDLQEQPGISGRVLGSWLDLGGKAVFFRQQDDKAEVVAINPATGGLETLLSEVSGPVPEVRVSSSGSLIAFPISRFERGSWRLETGVWRLKNGVQKLRWTSSAEDMRPRVIIDDMVYTDAVAAREVLRSTTAPPEAMPGLKAFLIAPPNRQDGWGNASHPGLVELPERTLIVDPATWIFYIATPIDGKTAELFVWKKESKSWTSFARNVSVQVADRSYLQYASRALTLPDPLNLIRADSEDGLVAFVSSDAAHDLRLYDATIDKTITLGNVSGTSPDWRVEISRVRGLDDRLVTAGDAAFIYKPGSGKALALGVRGRAIREIVSLDKEGRGIYVDSSTGRILAMAPNQPPRQLWPTND